MKRRLLTLAAVLLLGAGLFATAQISACISRCPWHPHGTLKESSVTTDGQGNITGAVCKFTCGCSAIRTEKKAEHLGIARYLRVPAPGLHPGFIRCLARRTIEALG